MKILTRTLISPERGARLLMLASMRAAGDLPGHEFHGNQWVDAGGGRGPAPQEFDEVLHSGELRSASSPNPIEASAISFEPKFEVAARYAFAMGRRAAKRNPKDVDAIVRAVRTAFRATLPRLLLDCLVAGGRAAVRMLGGLRAAGDLPGHEFHGNQYVDGPADGHTRLYRIEPKVFTDNSWLKKHMTPEQWADTESARGRLFTDNLEKAVDYGFGADTHHAYFVDVPDHVAVGAKRQHPEGWHEYLLPKEHVARKKAFRSAGDVDGHPFHGNQWVSADVTVKRTEPHYGGSETLDFKLPGGAGNLMLGNDLTDPIKDYLKIVAIGVDDKRAGHAFTLVKTALDHVKKSGYKGISSRIEYRTKSAQRFWNSLKKHGADIEERNGYALLKSLEGVTELRTAALLSFKFIKNWPAAAKWAREHGLDLADELSETTRADVILALERAFSGDYVGAAQELILQAVGDQARAKLIARTETMRASNEGQQAAWDQALADGYLTGKEKKDLVQVDPCPLCIEMKDEGPILVQADWSGGSPPFHPNCRCVEGLVG